ncbi:acyltransferase domain-containing protein, partial [Amycolatopsis sp. K13G38]
MSEQLDRRLARNPIAIVGMSGLFPMARNHREYWQNIVNGTDCTEEVPASRWSLDDYYDADPAAQDKTYSRRGAFLPDIDFDPLEFGLPPNQLEVTSTMQTLSLGVARDLLRDAGADGDWYDPERTGCVLGTTGPVPLMHPLAARLSTPVLREVVRSCGLSEQDASAIADKYVKAFAPWEENSFPGLLANVVAGRVANRLGLGGMNTTVDAACAASLSAVRTAIAELVDGRADTMITGGVDTENTIFIYLCFSKVGALSKKGTISPFDDSADGTLLGEGIGMLALRRLADARRDGNRIYAVIRGIGSSSDGRAKSIYAPVAAGQKVALERAYADADCSPASVELFEAHATGTAVGDRTELTALGELLREADAEKHTAGLGSVKSQIGHTKGAAGTASVMKLALGLYHKVLPPTINVEKPNSAVDFADGPFYVNVKTRPWVRDPHRPVRRAAASAMGFGGTNFHMVLEEHDHGPILHRTPRVHLWHAPDREALLELLRSDAPSSDGEEIPPSHARIGFVAVEDFDELRELAVSQLSSSDDDGWSLPRGVFYRRSAMSGLKVGALFAGQGSQYLDMGLEAAINNPVVSATLDEANQSFEGASPRLAQVMYPPPVFDAEARQEQEAALRRTDHAQPAIGALSAGQFRFLRELGLECAGYLGHSFGELTALWASGAVSDVDFYRLARARGQAMVPVGEDAGAMAAISASREEVTSVIAEFSDVVVCNHNAPDQVVVGGGTEEVEKVIAACGERGLTARRLPVAAAFHTRFVSHAVEAFRPVVESVRVGEPATPVYANSPGAVYGPDAASNAATLVEQLLRPVEFVAALEAMCEAGCTVFVEFGPKQVLTSLVRRTLGEDVIAIPVDGGPLGDSDVALKQAALRLAVLGAPIKNANRYDAPALPEPQKKSHAVVLSAPEYVPAERREAYEDALNGGYRVALPEPHRAESNGAGLTGAPAGLAAAAPAPDPAGVAPAASAVPAPVAQVPSPAPAAASNGRGVGGALQQHLAVHGEYLEGQLRVAEQLASVLSHGGVDASLAEAVTAVKDQSIAIGQAHTRANEILAALAEIELGATPAPTRVASQVVAAPQMSGVDAELQALISAPAPAPT